LPLLNTRRASTEIRELQSLIVGSHCCDAGNNSVLLDNQLYFDKCSNHAFYSAPSAAGLFVYSDEGYSMVAKTSVHYSFHSLVSRVNI